MISVPSASNRTSRSFLSCAFLSLALCACSATSTDRDPASGTGSTGEAGGGATGAIDGTPGKPVVDGGSGGLDDGGEAFGPFVVTWTPGDNGLGQLTVKHSAEPDRVLWETALNKPFISAARGVESVDSSRGSFVFQDAIKETCSGQTVESFEINGKVAMLKGQLKSCSLPYTLSFENIDDRQLGFTLALGDRPGAKLNRLTLTYASSRDEGFYGFGAQYTRGAELNMKGKLLPIWSQEQGHGRGLEPITTALRTFAGGAAGDWWTTYTAVPFYLTSTRRGFLLENSEYLEMDFQKDAAVDVRVFSAAMHGRILYGKEPLDIVESFTRYSGRMSPLPAWSQKGAVVRVHGGTDKVRKAVETLIAHKTPIAGVWIEDWAGSRETSFGTRMWWNWDVDRALYPNWPELLAWLNAREIRPMIYFNPFITDASTKPNVTRVLFTEARDSGYLVENADGSPHLVESGGFSGGLIDLTNPDARAWLETIMRGQLDLGVYGWMADFGEALPYECQVASKEDPKTFHNRYTYEWAKFNREVMKNAGREDDGLFFNRSGTSQSPGQAKLFWIGDQIVTWDDYDGFKTVVPALLSAGLSGYALEHTDTGGWLSVSIPLSTFHRSQELLTRWFEVSAFTSFFRTHHTNQPADNHQYDTNEETFKLFSRASHIFAALAPYRAKLMAEASTRGYPLLRHLALHFPDDPRAWDARQEMMLGSELIIAPVVDQGAKEVTAYLPAGKWVHLWSQNVYGSTTGGSEVRVAAPIGEPAVFYRNGSADGAALVKALKARGVM